MSKPRSASLKLAVTRVLTISALTLAGCGGDDTAADAGGGTAAHETHGSTATGPHSHGELEGTPVSLTDFAITPAAYSGAAGELKFGVSNDGQSPHDFVIRDDTGEVLGRTRVLNPGEGETLTITLAPGTYTLFCSLGGHESLGMKAELMVE